VTTKALAALLGLTLAAAILRPAPAAAQENFEIQVYGSETLAAGSTMVELHSNVAAEGTRETIDHVLRTQGAFHETRAALRHRPRALRFQSSHGRPSVPAIEASARLASSGLR
jgi:hypothetical protein